MYWDRVGHNEHTRESKRTRIHFVLPAEEPTEGSSENQDCIYMKQEKLPDENHLEMAPWYSMFLFDTAFELMLSLRYSNHLFHMSLSHMTYTRFDRRSLQRAIHSSDDDYIFDHLASRDEVWLDFVADCGDGFDSSYQVARLLAQPDLEVECSAMRRKGGKRDQKRIEKRVFPRGDVLIVGGDLAYPHPNA